MSAIEESRRTEVRQNAFEETWRVFVDQMCDAAIAGRLDIAAIYDEELDTMAARHPHQYMALVGKQVLKYTHPELNDN